MTGKSLSLAFLSLALIAGGQPAEAASFDCDKAKTPDEKAICADRTLNDQDVEMSVLYTQLKPLLGMGARGDMEDAQATWLKHRETCGSDRTCLNKAYEERVLQLRGGFEALAKRGPF
jgi:uncharacterized protein